MADARELLIKLTVDAAQADKRLKDIEKSTKAAEKSFGDLHGKLSAVSGSLKSFAAGLAGAFTLGAMVSAFKAATDAMDDMAKASQKVGVTTESLSALKYAAGQSGVGFEGLQTGLRKLNQELADVDKGATDTAKALRAMGVKGGDSPEAALAKIADVFADVPDGAQKSALAIKIFGKAGADMIPLLNEGSAGIKRLEERAQRLGAVIDKDTAKQAERFNDSLSDMQTSLGGIVKNIVAGAMPAFSGIAASLADSASAGKEWKQLGRGLGEVFGFLVGTGLKVVATFQALGTLIAGVGASAALFATGNFKAAGQTFGQMIDDVNGIEASTNARLENLKKAMAGFGETAEPIKKAGDGVKKFANAMKGLQTDDSAKKAADAMKKAADAAKEYAASLDKIAAIEAEARELGNKFILGEAAKEEAIRKQISALEDAADPMRVWKREMEALEELMTTGKVSAEAYSAELARIGKKLADASKPAEETKNMLASLKDAIDGYAKDMAGAWVSALSSGQSFKDSFMDITASVLKNIAQMILQIGVIEPLMKRFKDSLSGSAGGGIGSWLGGLFGFAHGGAFGGGTGLPFGIYNQPTFFPMAGSGPLKKFASGGVLGEAGPEAILPLRRTAGGSLGVQSTPANVNVNVINNAGAAVSVSQDSNGDTTILIEKAKRAIANDIRRGGNDVAGAFESTYRVSRGG